MKKFILLLICIFTFVIPTSAEVVQFTLDEAIKIALNNNLELQSKRKNLEALMEDAKIVNALKNPQLQSNILIGRVTESNSSQVGIGLPIEIAKRGVRKKAALANLKVAENQVRQAEHNLKLEVMGAYFDILYMKSVVFILKEREELYRDMLVVTEAKSQNSPNYKLEMLQADIKHKRQLVLLNRAKANLLNAQFHLNDVLNLKDTSVMYDTSELYLFGNPAMLRIKIPDYPLIEETAMQYSYSIKIADSNIEKSKQDLSVAKHMVIPNVTAAGGFVWQSNQSLYGTYVGAFADIPVLYTYRPDVRKAGIILERTKIDKASFETRLKFALKEDYNKFKYAKQNIEYYKEILEKSDEILKLSKDKYNKGELSFMHLMLVENSRQENINEYINAMDVYYHAYLDLMQNVGHDILLEESLL